MKYTHLFWGKILLALMLLSSCGDKSHEEKGDGTTQTSEFKPSWIVALDREIAKDSTNPELYLKRAQAYYDLGNFRKAEEDILKATRLDTTFAEAYLLRAKLYMEAQDYKRAMRLLLKARRLKPQLTETHLLIGQIFFYVQKYQDAIASLMEAIKQNPADYRPYFYLGLIYKEIADTAQAINAFHKAIEIGGPLYHAYMQLGLLYDALGRPEAEDYFEAAIRLDSASAEAWYALAMFYKNRQQPQKALEIFKEMAKRFPQYEKGLYGLGYMYFEMDSLDKARRLFYMATQVAPYYAKAYYMMGLIDELKGDTSKAAWAYEQALALDPEFELAKEAYERVKPWYKGDNQFEL